MKNKQFRISYAPLAFDDLDEIDDYISQSLHNPSAAQKLLDQFQSTIDQLKEFPMLGSRLNDRFLAKKGYRKLVVQNYLVFYLVNEPASEIIIARILYGAREYRHLL